MRFLLTLISIIIVSFSVNAQADSVKQTLDTGINKTDTLAPFEKNPFIPTFSIQLRDSSWYYNTKLKKNKPVLIIYFSPDCGHCQIETEDIIAKINGLKNLQIVMVTSRPFEDMVKFAAHYKLSRFPSIKIGKDHAYFFSKFYDVKFTPFSALYDKNGKLVKSYEKGINYKELIDLVN